MLASPGSFRAAPELLGCDGLAVGPVMSPPTGLLDGSFGTASLAWVALTVGYDYRHDSPRTVGTHGRSTSGPFSSSRTRWLSVKGNGN